MKYDAKRYYAFLGVDPACSDEDLRAAFRRRAKQLHPDSESGNEDEFIQLKKAYDVLAEPAKRAQYDRISRPRSLRTLPPLEWSAPLPPRRFRLGGMSLARFAAAFVFMAGLSVAALEVILVDSDVAPSALFSFAVPRPDPVRSAERRASMPSQIAAKSFSPPPQADETAEEFAERMQRAHDATRLDSPALGARPAP